MRFLKCMSLGLGLLAMGLSVGCASTEVEDEDDRRSYVLEEDNDSLRKKLTDLGAVESALNRELATQKGQLEQARNRAADLERRNRDLEAEKSRLASELASATSNVGTPSRQERPVADLQIDGLSGKDVEVVNDAEGVLVRMSGAVMFRPGRDELTSAGKRILDRVSSVLKTRPDVFVSVEGHTDAKPLGKSKQVWGTNLALSLARAMSVHDYLKRERSIPEDRMRVVGWGEHKPLIPGQSDEANARNRRVELVLLRGQG